MIRYTIILVLSLSLTSTSWAKDPKELVIEFALRIRSEASDKFKELKQLARIPDNVYKSTACRRGLGAFAGTMAVGAGLYGYYNWNYRDGAWDISGDPDYFPSYIPKTGPLFQVDERIAALSIPARRSFWVHNGQNSFGKVFVEGDKLEYRRGKTVVASTEIISPFGRPYNREIPIRVAITDSSGKKLGTVEEVSEEVSRNVHQIHFRILDQDGIVVGETSSFQETSKSHPLKPTWKLSIQDGDHEERGELNRKSHVFTKSYQWKTKQSENEIDPRLLVILSAYKSYVESFRE